MNKCNIRLLYELENQINQHRSNLQNKLIKKSPILKWESDRIIDLIYLGNYFSEILYKILFENLNHKESDILVTIISHYQFIKTTEMKDISEIFKEICEFSNQDFNYFDEVTLNNLQEFYKKLITNLNKS